MTRLIACRLRHPESRRRLALPVIDRQDAGPKDLGHVGTFVEPQAEAGCDERCHQVVGRRAGEVRAERNPDRQVGKEAGEVVPEQDLDQDRCASEDPDVGGGESTEDLAGGEPHQRQDEPDDATQDHGDDRELDRPPDPHQHPAVEEVGPHHRPLEAVGGQEGGQYLDGDQDDKDAHRPRDRCAGRRREARACGRRGSAWRCCCAVIWRRAGHVVSGLQVAGRVVVARAAIQLAPLEFVKRPIVRCANSKPV